MCVINVLEAETKHMYDNNNNNLSKMSTRHEHILIYYYVFDVIIVTNRMQTSLWASALDYLHICCTPDTAKNVHCEGIQNKVHSIRQYVRIYTH